MIRWFKSGIIPSPWRGRCAVDTCDMSCYVWYKEWPNISGVHKRDVFISSLQNKIDSGRWVEDILLALDKDLLVDEGL